MTKKAKVIVAKTKPAATKKAKVLIATSAAKKAPKPATNAQHGTLMGVYADLEQIHEELEDSLDNVSDLMDEVEALKEGTFTTEGAKAFIAKLKDAMKTVKPMISASRNLEKALIKARDVGTKSEIKPTETGGDANVPVGDDSDKASPQGDIYTVYSTLGNDDINSIVRAKSKAEAKKKAKDLVAGTVQSVMKMAEHEIEGQGITAKHIARMDSKGFYEYRRDGGI
jgi:hypothetical protein